jgi:hypothetical protein
MITHAIVLSLLATTGASPPDAGGTFAYLKPSVTPVPADCKDAKAVAGLVRVPFFGDGSAPCPVARVEGGVITLGDLTEALAGAHEGRDAEAPAAKGKRMEAEFAPALDRLVQVRLIVDESRDMGMADVPEAKEALQSFTDRLLRLALETTSTADAKADPAEVERAYKESVREWKVKSVLFGKKEDATAFAAAVKKGKSFDELAAKAVADKRAKGGGEAEWVNARNSQQAAAQALARAKVGQVLPPVGIPSGIVVMRLDEIRYPEDKKAREAVEDAALARQKQAELVKLYDGLVKKYAKVDQALLKKLDWEKKKPGYAALAKDQRPVATIEGDPPVTVADLTAEMSRTFFHGSETPIKEKRVNREKMSAFRKLLASRLFLKEAKARNLQDTAPVRRAEEEYRRSVLFGTFVEKVLVPGVKVTEPDAKAYYEAHKGEYSYPQMYRLDAIAFGSAKAAQAAVERLRSGTDFQWMRANGDGQLPAASRTVQVDPNMAVVASSLPSELGKALVGSTTGEYRLYAPSENEVVVVRVVEAISPKAQPYLEVREQVARGAYDEKMKKAVQEYAEKLRAVRQVEIFITRIGS